MKPGTNALLSSSAGAAASDGEPALEARLPGACTIEQRVDPAGVDDGGAALDADEALAFCDAAWVSAWADALLPQRGWSRPLTWYSGGTPARLVGFCALAVQTVSRLRVSSLGGYYWPFRTLCVRGNDRTAFTNALAAHLSDRPPSMMMRFGPVSSADRAFASFLGALKLRGWHLLQQVGGDVFELALAPDFAAIEGAISSSLLKNARYCRRRMDKQLGGVSIERQVFGAGNETLLNTLAGIESASWVAAQDGETRFIGSANRRFWNALGQAGERASSAVAWVLRCGGEPIAFSAHVETSRTIYIIANGYDDAWKSHSPGAVLSLELIADACARGKQRIDWGQGDSGYKSRWGAMPASHLLDVMAFRPGVAGHAASLAALKLMDGWERVGA